MQKSLWYFGYGSNMNPEIFLERRGMRPQATRRGCLEDYRLCFNLPVGPGERGVANLEPAPGARTWGVLYLLTSDECERLDRTEGVHFGAYQRIDIEVSIDGGGLTGGFTYQSEHTKAGRRPSPRYQRLLVEGARQHRLPDDYLEFIESFELALDERESSPD